MGASCKLLAAAAAAGVLSIASSRTCRWLDRKASDVFAIPTIRRGFALTATWATTCTRTTQAIARWETRST
jgi:hypothetical protein